MVTHPQPRFLFCVPWCTYPLPPPARLQSRRDVVAKAFEGKVDDEAVDVVHEVVADDAKVRECPRGPHMGKCCAVGRLCVSWHRQHTVPRNHPLPVCCLPISRL